MPMPTAALSARRRHPLLRLTMFSLPGFMTCWLSTQSSLRTAWLHGQHLPGEVVVPLIEVQISVVPFRFAALQVDGFGTEEFLGRHEVAAIVVVERNAIGVESA